MVPVWENLQKETQQFTFYIHLNGKLCLDCVQSRQCQLPHLAAHFLTTALCLVTTILAWKIIGTINLKLVLWAERESYSSNTAWSTWQWQLSFVSFLGRWVFSLKAGRIHKSSASRPGERASGTNLSLSGSTATLDALPLPVIDTRFLCCLDRNLITILTGLELNTWYSHFNTIIHEYSYVHTYMW